ncbi:hypothetical protein DMN91_002763 [Ooceraea biroi]|uniref:Uncharacterized protein n=1 Tax=Ooceraea biroi TaxID=2015173 RepID=A0A026WNP2_OOCBI|nr:stress response protein NST1 [Ooceraea biroi]EZA57296.1 hypothetical protein X777_02547 [Ooceraea biroi]RLU24674.1 hypothetical protein DMN91_002763 [Ooceraea biroi]
MQTRNSSRSDNTSVKPVVNEGATSTEKEKLLREIQELESIVKQCEWNLETTRFRDVEKRATELLSSKTIPRRSKIPNVEVDLQNDLYRFAGLQCAQYRRQELIFNFNSMKEQWEDSIYALQIFLKNGKASLGKWVMPMSIDMNHLLTQTPIDDMKNLTSFLKNCKHNIDCYGVRQEQFLSLKERLSRMKYCVLQSNLGYTQITLELCGVYDSEDDKYINLVICIMYHSDRARPHKIEVDTTDKDKLSDDLRQRLKTSLKGFKILDLHTAFDKVLMEDNSAFTWIRTDDSDDSPMELTDVSSSEEEGFLAQVNSNRKKSLRKAGKTKREKRKQELQKKWNERKKRKAPLKSIGADEEEDEVDSRPKAKISRTESPLPRIPKKNEKEKVVASPSRQQKKIAKNLAEDTTPLMNPKVRLKQIKLNFQTKQATNSDSVDTNPLFQLNLRKKLDTKQLKTAKLITSTPISKNHKRIPSSSSLSIDSIPHIKPTKEIANKLNDSRNTNKLNSSRRSNRLSDSKDTGKMNDSRNTNRLDDSRNNNRLKDPKNTNKLDDSNSTTKLKESKKSNLPKNKNTLKKTNKSVQSKSKSNSKRITVRSTLRSNVPKTNQHPMRSGGKLKK